MAAPAWYGVDAGLDLLASRLGGRRRAREVRACCPVHQGDNDAALQLRASGDRIVARCYTSGCHQGPDGYADFARRLEEMTGVRLSEPPWERRPATRPPDRQHRPREREAPPRQGAGGHARRSPGDLGADPPHTLCPHSPGTPLARCQTSLEARAPTAQARSGGSPAAGSTRGLAAWSQSWRHSPPGRQPGRMLQRRSPSRRWR